MTAPLLLVKDIDVGAVGFGSFGDKKAVTVSLAQFCNWFKPTAPMLQLRTGRVSDSFMVDKTGVWLKILTRISDAIRLRGIRTDCWYCHVPGIFGSDGLIKQQHCDPTVLDIVCKGIRILRWEIKHGFHHTPSPYWAPCMVNALGPYTSDQVFYQGGSHYL